MIYVSIYLSCGPQVEEIDLLLGTGQHHQLLALADLPIHQNVASRGCNDPTDDTRFISQVALHAIDCKSERMEPRLTRKSRKSLLLTCFEGDVETGHAW